MSLPEAIAREEQYYAYMAGTGTALPEPITRKDRFLYYLCTSGVMSGATQEQIEQAVNNYLSANPVQPGATEEQAQQIQKNKDALGGISFSITERGILRASWEE